MSDTITLTDGKATIDVPTESAYALEALGWLPIGGRPEADEAPEPKPKASAQK